MARSIPALVKTDLCMVVVVGRNTRYPRNGVAMS
jgi:hypothetical protein